MKFTAILFVTVLAFVAGQSFAEVLTNIDVSLSDGLDVFATASFPEVDDSLTFRQLGEKALEQKGVTGRKITMMVDEVIYGLDKTLKDLSIKSGTSFLAWTKSS